MSNTTRILCKIEDDSPMGIENDSPLGLPIVFSKPTFMAHEKTIKVVREAVLEFAKTEEGKEGYRDSSEDFNWGDLVNHLDDPESKIHASLKRLRIHYLQSSVFDVMVDHDEQLMVKGRP